MSLLNLPDRTVAPRRTGLTMVNDIGIGLAHARDLVNTYGSLMDFVKFGVGTAYVMPHLEEKISIFQEAGIRVYFGGTLFEKFYAQNKLGEYLKYLEKLNIRHIEISNGTIELRLEDRSGSVCLNSRVWFYKWIPTLVMPPPVLATVH